jgi:UTP--glucose-1-phosphate uridylyltransferase
VSSSDCEAPHPELLLLQRRLSGSIAEESVEMAHPRANSIVKFEEDKFHSARVAMRDELTKLLEALPPGTQDREAFERDMESFYILFLRFLSGINEKKLDWNLVRSLGDEHLLQYATLPEPSDDRQSHALLSKLAVVKLNGGLGTTMGCVGPKSAIEVREGLTFLDLSVRQMEVLKYIANNHVP